MRASDILEAIGGVNEAAIADADKRRRRFPAWAKALSIAACLCLVLLGSFSALFSGMGAGAGGGSGDFAEGWYYYTTRSHDLYRHSPDRGSEKVLDDLRFDAWEVNDYGLYYCQNRRLYVIPHDSGKSRLLYRAGLFDSSHIAFSLQTDGNVIVTVYNKHKQYFRELLLDGATGELLETLMDATPYLSADLKYSDTHLTVGERRILLERAEEGSRYGGGCTVSENGESLLPEGVCASAYAKRFGENLWLECYTDDMDDYTFLVLRPNGDDSMVTLPSTGYIPTGTSDWLFYVGYDYEQELYCFAPATGEYWRMNLSKSWDDLYDISTDGTLMYSSAPWTDAVSCWKLLYEDGRPVGIELMDGDINQ